MTLKSVHGGEGRVGGPRISSSSDLIGTTRSDLLNVTPTPSVSLVDPLCLHVLDPKTDSRLH